MSTHPNAILMSVINLGLDKLSDEEKINKFTKIQNYLKLDYCNQIKIENNKFDFRIMEDDYDESYQLSAPMNSIVIFDMITYGYGEIISWEKTNKLKEILEKLSSDLCREFNGTYEIFITANYW